MSYCSVVDTVLLCLFYTSLKYTYEEQSKWNIIWTHLCKNYMPLYARIISGRTEHNPLIAIISKARILVLFITYPCVLQSLIFK